MRWLILFVFAPAAWANDARSVLKEYAALAMPAEDAKGEARTARLNALAKLRELPQADVVAAVGEAINSSKDAPRRAELVETLRDFASQEAAEVVVKALGDADAEVRKNAIHTLRLYSRKVDRIGGKREQRAAFAKPKVDGLVPHLIKAADDTDETNRWFVLYALADAMDQQAYERICGALNDASENVRLIAACMLSEFNDASGMAELKSALIRIRALPKDNPTRWMNAERIVSSMERLTGKSFGRLPMNPLLVSDTRVIERYEKEYEMILDAWAKWWDWEPGK